MENPMADACEPTRVTEVEQELNRSYGAIAELDARLDQLRDKVAPALRELSSKCEAEEPTCSPNLCELAGKIRGNRESVEIFVRRVNDILDRLEI